MRGISQAATPKANFLRLARLVELLMENGASKGAIDALIKAKILADLATEKAKRLAPSRN